ncbi:MAG: hypothetical protein OSJ67_00630 [Clostridia bacterium]|nr:hypothetical protein [Clostridia bacterium]
MREKVLKTLKIIVTVILIVAMIFIIFLAIKALNNSKIDFDEIDGKIFVSSSGEYIRITAKSVIINRTNYEIESIDNDIIVVHREEDKPFLIKIINESTIFCELERRYYYEKD